MPPHPSLEMAIPVLPKPSGLAKTGIVWKWQFPSCHFARHFLHCSRTRAAREREHSNLIPLPRLQLPGLGESTKSPFPFSRLGKELCAALMATLSGQLVLALFLLGLTILPSGVQAIYCDDDNCYDLLGLTQAATPQEVKQAYRKLSLKYHPDKNPDPEATATFLKISNAYEILGDESRREDYDYALEHPEYFLWNTARYYQAYYGPQADPLSVLLGLLLVLSAFQYLNQWTRYRQMVDMVKQTPAYKNKLKALELERSGGSGNRKKASKVKSSKGELEDLSKELDLQIQGAEKPVLWGLLGIQVAILPFTIVKLLVWRVSWMWRYWVKRLPYSWEDAALLTRRSLGIAATTWSGMSAAAQGDLIFKRLWVKSNLSKYVEDARKDARRRR